MRVISIKQYNGEQTVKYKQRCKDWKPGKGGFPQIAFCYFWDNDGNKRETGYVAISEDGRGHYWAETPELAIKKGGG